MLISVLIPAYNCEKTIGRALASALAQQTNADIEIIVVDDASDDATFYRASEFVRNYGNIILLSNEVNRGVAYTRNVLIDHAQGEWIAFLDADDIFTKTKVQRCIEVAAETGADLIAHGIGYLKKDGSITGRVGAADFLQSSFIRRASIGNHRFDPDLRAGEDSAFFSKLKAGVRYFRIPDILTGLSILPGSLTDSGWLQKRYVEFWHAEHQGQDSPDDAEEYKRYLDGLPWRRRFRLMRLWYGQKAGRLGAGLMLEGRRMRALPFFTISLVCEPRYLLSRLRHWR